MLTSVLMLIRWWMSASSCCSRSSTKPFPPNAEVEEHTAFCSQRSVAGGRRAHTGETSKRRRSQAPSEIGLAGLRVGVRNRHATGQKPGEGTASALALRRTAVVGMLVLGLSVLHCPNLRQRGTDRCPQHVVVCNVWEDGRGREEDMVVNM